MLAQHLDANGTKRGPKFEVLNYTIKLVSQRRIVLFSFFSVVTHKDASNNTVKYLNFVSVWFRSHANVAQACSIVLSAHQVILPIHSRRSDPQAPPGEGLTPHTIHHYSFGPLQAITVVDQSDRDSRTVILTIPSSLLY